MKKKLLVISIDSMVKEDMEIIRELPCMGQLIKKSSVILENEATYPTLTHSVHASILTGCTPMRHGIIGNEHFVPGDLSSPWYERADELKVKGMLDFAREQGLSTAAVMYPLTLGGDYDWILHRAEFHCGREDEEDCLRERCRPHGLFDEILNRVGTYPVYEGKQERADAFCFDTIEYLLDEKQPDVMYAHVVTIDHTRHQYGVFSPQLREAYEFLDRGFQQVWEALVRNGLDQETILCVTADHGHLDVRRVVSINRLFRTHGLLQVDEDGNLTDWRAYLHSNSLSAYIYIRKGDKEAQAEAYRLLKENQELLGIEKIRSREEVKEEYHLDGDFTFVLESCGDTSFSSDYNAALIRESGDEDYRYSIATHGHEPQKGVQPLCFIYNPFSDKRLTLQRGRIIDQAPTLAVLADIQTEEMEGNAISELVKLMPGV